MAAPLRDTRVRGAKRCPLGSFLRRDPPSISEIAPGEPRNPPSISEIHVSIGSTVSITQQPINGIDNADTILGDARAELVKRDVTMRGNASDSSRLRVCSSRKCEVYFTFSEF